MRNKRTRRTKDFKFKVAIEAIKSEKQIAELAAEYDVHPQQITAWKKELFDKCPELFSASKETKQQEREKEQLYKMIGHQQVRIDWLKKTLGISHDPFGED
jgi:transposase-like protein